MAAGRVNTTWKYGTGNRSASRAASQSFAAAPWHFGQCRLRQELYEIWLCAQSSQRATWPPRAAVRQLSIADITLSWPRLTWPALAVRHAGPWSRKIHETSALGGRLVRLGLEAEALQRAHDRPDGVGGDAGIERRGVDLGMSEENLDHSDIGVLLQKVGCKAMPQRVRRHPFGDLGQVGRRMAGAVELARRYRLQRVLAREQPGLWLCDAPPVAQKLQQHRRQHRVSILAAFALLDAQQHALAVDVGHLQRRHLRYAQARPIGDAERGLVLDARGCLQKARHLLGAENDRNLARLRNERQVFDDVGPIQRNGEEEPQRRNRTVDGRGADVVRGEMQLEKPQLFGCRRIG